MGNKRLDLKPYANNDTFMGRVCQLMLDKGVSLYEMCEKTGIKEGTFNKNVKTGKIIKNTNMQKIAEVLGVSMELLEHGKETAKNIIDLPQPKPNVIKVYTSVAAGKPIERWDNEVTEIELNFKEFKNIKGEIVGFRVDGDSMLERFRRGDILFTTEYKNTRPKDKDFVVVFYDTGLDTVSGNIKLFFWANKEKTQFILKSVNAYFPDTVHNWEMVTKIFKVHLALSPIDYKS